MKNGKCAYEHEENCECREDNNCGCTYPNNMRDDIMCSDIYISENSSEIAGNAEYVFNQNGGEGIFACPVCGAATKDCACHKK